MAMEIILSLGSNMGDRLDNLQTARDCIADLSDVEVVATSPAYETEPVNVDDAFKDMFFLNAILVLESNDKPEKLVAMLHIIEDQMGRTRSSDRNMPRPVDIDMIAAGDHQMTGQELTLPHPRWAERRFVVQPLADVRPGLVLPGQARSVANILASLPETPTVRIAHKTW